MEKLVLNLVISGIPSILLSERKSFIRGVRVLNLVISGIPSILTRHALLADRVSLF